MHEAVEYAIAAMADGGAYASRRTSSRKFQDTDRCILRKLLSRVWYGLDGFEDHTSVATMRGFSAIFDMGKSAMGERIKKYWRYGLIDYATEMMRRGASQTESPTPGSNLFWFNPSHFCIGPTLREFFFRGSEDGTDLAVLPLENQNRTKVLPPSEDNSPRSTLHPETEAQEFQNVAGGSSGFPPSIESNQPIGVPYASPKGVSPVPSVRPPPPADIAHGVAQAISGVVRSAALPRNLVHPEGGDIGRVLHGVRSPETLARVQKRQVRGLLPDPEHERRKAQIVAEAQAEAAREAAQPSPLPPDPPATPPALEASIARFGRLMGIGRKPDDG